jgi:predicted nucleic acid-binding protein
MSIGQEVCVDASVAVKVVVTEPDSDKADALFSEWANEGTQLIAPAFFEVETDSILRQKVALRKELTPEQAEAVFATLQTLPIHQMAVLGQRQRAWEIATTYGFATVYDATYLALAEVRRWVGCDEEHAQIGSRRATKRQPPPATASPPLQCPSRIWPAK